ncbi:MAG: hypothetical protein HY033_04660 [Ignavibacteriae bacterium]|nr:hypothetical protein [Ignavibacteria bacterium]MBI3364180.1 hypothetical protein [Ignavibacteriota bacterium]
MKRRCFIFPLLLIIVVLTANAADKSAFDFARAGGRSLGKTAVGVAWAKRVLQGYNMRVWLSNQMAMGIEAWDPFNVPDGDCGSPGIGMEYPVGACIEHLYGAAPFIGGKINGAIHVSEGYNGDDARMEFLPERQDTARDKIWRTHAGTEEFHPNNDGYSGYYWRNNIQVNRRGCDDDGDGKVDEDDLDGQDNDGDWNPLTDDIGADGLPDSLEVSCDGKTYNAATNPDPAYDNYDPGQFDKCHLDQNGNYIRKRDKDKYTQNNGKPDHGEPHVDEDYAALSDNDLYMAATDTFRSFTIGSHFPMGVKLFQKSYAWAGDFAEGVLPMDYFFVNVGRNVIHDAYVGFFADMDVGPVNVPIYYTHDYACYFADLRTAYIHNAQDRGATPAGITVLGTPRPLDSLKYVFQWHGFNNPGTDDSVIYAWMSGQAFPNQLIKTCQTPDSPTDTRFFFAFGPFDGLNHSGFRPGDTLKISVALVSGEGVEDGPNNLHDNAEKALKLYLRGYRPPINLPSPPLQVTNLLEKPYGVKLEWGGHLDPLFNPVSIWDDSNKLAQADTGWRTANPPCSQGVLGCEGGHLCSYDSAGHPHLTGGRIFEGYRLYRSEDPKDNPRDKSWTLVRQYDMAGDGFEFNTGIDTVFYDTNLVRGKRYWYSVTSFGIPDIAVIPIKDAQGNLHFDTLFARNVESPLSENRKSVDIPFSVSEKIGEVRVVPNPYRVDQDYTYENGGWEKESASWDEGKRLVKFIHLPNKCTIRIFSLAGDLVTTLLHDDPERGELEWNILSESGRALASGIYIFTVESNYGKQIGKFALIR